MTDTLKPRIYDRHYIENKAMHEANPSPGDGEPIYREAWRYRGLNTRFNRFKRSVPGFGIATVAFAAYCTYEHFFLQDDHGHHDSGHAEEKHH
ncbi:hypothetical protein B0T24DRAFT_613064 [Lasiosphaeria ovina]|uniref:NADH-ubiquinone oxidoreductase B12 subunit n=1 Tax=Lasiosphaeria ovina TaxID=92902 RepID=A0AAE0NE81_9PEZI|nr:hypothetical protein B0T24DRAFT_613064 [Lasiosphaeria ovina]